jgi:hypothetical protein
VPDFGWPELVALLTSVGFGVVSAVVPVANAEAYVIGSQVSAVAGAVPIAVASGRARNCPSSATAAPRRAASR